MASITKKPLELPLKIFYSYAHEDEDLREKLETHLSALERQSLISEWKDLDITAGTEWDQEINQHLESADIILLLISSDFIASDFCYGKEMDTALQRHEAGEACVIPIIMREVDWHGAPFGKLQALPTGGEPVTGWRNRDEAYTNIAKGIRAVIFELTGNPLAAPKLQDVGSTTREDLATQPIHKSPYNGLFAFQETDAKYFFGRETFTDKLVEEVHKKPLVAVIGPSGSGKSSVVFAGLVPRLREEGDWHIVTYRPGEHPRKSLVAALMPSLESEMSEADRLIEINKIVNALNERNLTAEDIVNRIVQKDPEVSNLLLIADQFEEVYTLCQDAEERQTHIDGLLEAFLTPRREGIPNLTLVITMRADFLSHALSYRPLADALQDTDVKLGPMTHDELQDAIEKPAKTLGVSIEDGLTERILDDVSERPGYLPMLEFALTLLWERQRNGELTHKAYDEIGGVERALASHAEQEYEKLDPDAQQHVQRIFTQLVRPGEGTVDTRRVATRTEIGEENWALVTRLADARLVVSGHDEATGQDTVEVAHEALIEGWDLLHQWVNADRAFLMWKERLRAAMRQWLASNKDDGALLRGAPLGEARQWLETRQHNLSQAEQEFIQAGIAQRELERAQEEAHKKRELELAQEAAKAQRSAANRLRFIAVALALSLLVAVGLSAWALDRSQAAQANANSAQQSLTHSNALRLAVEATNLMQNQGDAQTIALLSIRSMNGQYTPQGDGMLAVASTLEYPSHVLTTEGAGGMYGVAFSPNGKYAATGGFDKVARLWDVQTGQQIRQIEHDALVYEVAFSPDGNYLLTASNKNQNKVARARLWDVQTGEEVRQFPSHDDDVRDATFSPDGKYVLTGNLDNTARLRDAVTGKEIRQFRGHEESVSSVAFSPDGNYVLTGSLDETARLWDAKTGQEMHSFNTSSVIDVAFSPDGKSALTGGFRGIVQLWDLTTRQEVRSFIGHTATVEGVAFSPDSKYIITGSDDKTARLWDAATGKELRRVTGIDSTVSRVAISPDGNTALFGSFNSKAFLWDLTVNPGLPRFVGHTDILQGVDFSPDGKYLLTTSPDTTARLWDTHTGQEIRQFLGHTDGLGLGVFSHDGKYVLTGSSDKTARLWDAVSGNEIRQFLGHTDSIYGVAFSPDDKYVLTAGGDYTGGLWETATARRVLTLTGHTRYLTEVAFSPDGKTLLGGAADGMALLWDAQTGQEIRRFEQAKNDPVMSVAFSPDGKYVLTGSYAGPAYLWDAATAQKIGSFIGATGVLWSVRFSSDGKYVLAASGDKTARLWETATGNEVRRFVGHLADVYGTAFSPDGKYIATASDDRTARLWYVDYHATIQYLCSRLMRDLTDDERKQYSLNDTTPTCPKP